MGFLRMEFHKCAIYYARGMRGHYGSSTQSLHINCISILQKGSYFKEVCHVMQHHVYSMLYKCTAVVVV